MKSIGELMHEIGFNKDASDETKKAFIKQIIKNAFPKDIKIESICKTDICKSLNHDQQLSFNFELQENKGQKVS